MAITLAHDRSRLASIKQRLQQERAQHALFDTPQYTRELEENIEQVWASYKEKTTSAETATDAATAAETPSETSPSKDEL